MYATSSTHYRKTKLTTWNRRHCLYALMQCKELANHQISKTQSQSLALTVSLVIQDSWTQCKSQHDGKH